MDGQLLRPKADLVAIAKNFVCVRVTDMQAIDLNRYPFDFDLTLAIVLANADGTIYHRYGGRPKRDPMAWTSRQGIVDLLRATLPEHKTYAAAPRQPKKRPKHTVYDIEDFKKRMARKKQKPACIHCHQIHDARVRDRQERGAFDLDMIWVWPEPERVGLSIDPKDQAQITAVAKDSAAHAAGLRVGDRLVIAGDQRLLTINDLQWALHNLPLEGGRLPITYRRDGTSRQTTLRAKKGFKRCDPHTYSWRAMLWSLRPAPGFGGNLLDAGTKKRLGIANDAWAFKVTYIVDWNDRPQQGRENRRAGIRNKDVVTSWGGRSDFRDMPHFHAWVRFTKKRGDKITIELLRGGKKKTVRVTLQ